MVRLLASKTKSHMGKDRVVIDCCSVERSRQKMELEFPISVHFENDEVREYDDVHDLIHNLEDYGSSI